jgi:uncharacterized protein
MNSIHGLGIGWRPELALDIERHSGLNFIEVVAEDLNPRERLPAPLRKLRERGLPIIPHGISLSLGGAEPPDRSRMDRLARLAEMVQAPLVSEHLSFVRAGRIESGHLLPLARTAEMLDIVVENIEIAKRALPVPLAIENVSTLFEWPHAEMDEAAFLREVLERADIGLLLDIENVYANARNHGYDPLEFLDRIPLERIAYVHIAGGIERGCLYHDTHTATVPRPVLALLEELSSRVALPGVMLERDDEFPSPGELYAELEAIHAAIKRGRVRREVCHVG